MPTAAFRRSGSPALRGRRSNRTMADSSEVAMEVEVAEGKALGEEEVEEVAHPLLLKVQDLESAFEQAREPLAAVQNGASAILDDGDDSEGALKAKEAAMYLLAKMLCRVGNVEGLKDLLFSHSAFFARIPKAKTAKIVRSILDMVEEVPDSLVMQVDLTKAVIQWCIRENRTFLRHRMQARFANMQYLSGEYHEGP
eukprot:scaffold2008_cov283-Pinguiococcus_pyrenoidosus.AAC.20